ncbi:MAG: TonB-dependent receptor [Bacteroidota bacterium]
MNRLNSYILSIVSVCSFSFSPLFAQFEGVVVDAETDLPLEYATLVSEGGKSVILSGPEGTFTIDKNVDSLEVTVSHLGYHQRNFTLYKNAYTILALFPDYNQIGEVVIQTTHFNSTLKSSAGSITLLNSELINNSYSPTVTDIMNMGPGLFMAQGTLSTNRLIIRGIGSRNPYGTNRIRMYFGEIPVNSIDGSSSPENINPDVLDRIEVLKGPSSAIYGAGLGGTVMMIPEYRSSEGFSATLNSSVHSWGGYNLGVSSSYKKNNSSLKIAAKQYHTNGYRENSDYTRRDLYLGGKVRGEKLNVTYLLNFLDLKAGIPSSLSRSDYVNSPQMAADSWAEVGGFEDFQNFITGVNMDYRLGDKIFGNTGLFSNYGNTYESRPFNIFDAEQIGVGMRQSFEYRGMNLKLTGGYEAVLEQSEWDIYETLGGNQGQRLNAMKDNRYYISGFLHSAINPVSGLRIEPALSLTYIQYNLEDQFDNEEDLSGDYSYDPEISPRLGINYNLLRNLYVYGSVGHGFSPPSLEETLLPEGEANTALKPESGWTFDLGLKGNHMDSRLFYDFTLYYIRLSDLLLTERITEDQFIGVNAGKTNHYGAEFFLRYHFSGIDITELNSLFFTSSLNFSQNRFVDFFDDNVDYSGNALPGIPTTSLNFSLDYSRMETWNLIVKYRFYGKQFMDDANSVYYPGHQLIDLKAGYKNLKIADKFSLEIYGAINNLLNADYASMILVNAPSFGGAEPRYYYPGNPRNFLVGLKVLFD